MEIQSGLRNQVGTFRKQGRKLNYILVSEPNGKEDKVIISPQTIICLDNAPVNSTYLENNATVHFDAVWYHPGTQLALFVWKGEKPSYFNKQDQIYFNDVSFTIREINCQYLTLDLMQPLVEEENIIAFCESLGLRKPNNILKNYLISKELIIKQNLDRTYTVCGKKVDKLSVGWRGSSGLILKPVYMDYKWYLNLMEIQSQEVNLGDKIILNSEGSKMQNTHSDYRHSNGSNIDSNTLNRRAMKSATPVETESVVIAHSNNINKCIPKVFSDDMLNISKGDGPILTLEHGTDNNDVRKYDDFSKTLHNIINDSIWRYDDPNLTLEYGGENNNIFESDDPTLKQENKTSDHDGSKDAGQKLTLDYGKDYYDATNEENQDYRAEDNNNCSLMNTIGLCNKEGFYSNNIKNSNSPLSDTRYMRDNYETDKKSNEHNGISLPVKNLVQQINCSNIINDQNHAPLRLFDQHNYEQTANIGALPNCNFTDEESKSSVLDSDKLPLQKYYDQTEVCSSNLINQIISYQKLKCNIPNTTNHTNEEEQYKIYIHGEENKFIYFKNCKVILHSPSFVIVESEFKKILVHKSDIYSDAGSNKTIQDISVLSGLYIETSHDLYLTAFDIASNYLALGAWTSEREPSSLNEVTFGWMKKKEKVVLVKLNEIRCFDSAKEVISKKIGKVIAVEEHHVRVLPLDDTADTDGYLPEVLSIDGTDNASILQFNSSDVYLYDISLQGVPLYYFLKLGSLVEYEERFYSKKLILQCDVYSSSDAQCNLVTNWCVDNCIPKLAHEKLIGKIIYKSPDL